MRLVFHAIVCLLCSLVVVNAAEIKLDSLTVGSRTYKDVRVLGANVTDMYFEHSGGFANAKLRHQRDIQDRR